MNATEAGRVYCGSLRRCRIARAMVNENRVPKAVALHLAAQQITHPDQKARMILQVFRNGEAACTRSGSDISLEERQFPLSDYVRIVDRQPYNWDRGQEQLDESRLGEFIDPAASIGPIRTARDFETVMSDKDLKQEVNRFIATGPLSCDRLANEMRHGLVSSKSVFDDIFPRNSAVTAINLAGLGVGLKIALDEVKAKGPQLTRRAIAAGLAVAFCPKALVSYRLAQNADLLPLSDNRYLGPKWPVLLALGSHDATITQLREVIDKVESHDS